MKYVRKAKKQNFAGGKTISPRGKETTVDDKRSVDEKASGSAFAFVAMSYLAVLTVLVARSSVLFWFFGNAP